MRCPEAKHKHPSVDICLTMTLIWGYWETISSTLVKILNGRNCRDKNTTDVAGSRRQASITENVADPTMTSIRSKPHDQPGFHRFHGLKEPRQTGKRGERRSHHDLVKIHFNSPFISTAEQTAKTKEPLGESGRTRLAWTMPRTLFKAAR